VFKNLSLAKKIAGGFAVLIILTVLVAVIGYNSVQTLNRRSEIADDANRLIKYMLEARREEKNFIIRGDADYINAVKQQVLLIQEQSKSTISKMNIQEDIDEMRAGSGAVAEYEKSFERYVLAQSEAGVLKEQWDNAGKQLAEKMDKIHDDLLQAQRNVLSVENNIATSQQWFNLMDMTNDLLVTAFLNLRLEVKDYMENTTQEQLSRLGSLSLEVTQGVDKWISETQTVAGTGVETDDIKKGLESFITFGSQFAAVFDKLHKADQEMVAAAQIVLDRADAVRETQKSRMDQEMKRVLQLLVLVLILSLLVGSATAYFVTTSITRPVAKLMELTTRGAEGDLTVSAKIDQQDEVGVLAESFNTMVSGLRELIGTLVNVADALGEESEELAASSEEISASIQQVASSSQQFASTTQQLGVGAHKMNETGQGVDKIAVDGEKTINEAVGQMTVIESSTEEITTAIDLLREQSEEIGSIVQTITSIADQTNLLALNAAIEAARAGEHGRGFAVVAEEVRKLAEQTGQATQHITDLVKKIQVETESAVGTMQQNSDEVKKGTHIIERSGDAFANIVASIRGLINEIQGVAAASEQISAGSQQIAGATEQQAASIQQVSAAADNLRRRAQELTRLAGQFKITS
jgi:methyl-accepting chemotaxis protein